MTQRIQAQRFTTTGALPGTGARPQGEFYVNFPDLKLGVIDPTQTARDLLPLRFFSATAGYNTGDLVFNVGQLYAARHAVAPAAFNLSDWDPIASTAGNDARYIAKAGGTMTGPLVLNADPTVPLGAATRQYVLATTALYLPLTGGSMTGPLTMSGATGIIYTKTTSRNAFAFSWDGANVTSWVDGSNVGALATRSFVSGNYLPLSGGTVTGAVICNDRIYADNGVSPSNYNGREWTLYSNGLGDKINQYRGGYYDVWQVSNGVRYWYSNNAQTMALDASGNLSVGGAFSAANITGWQVRSSTGRVVSVNSNGNPAVAVYDTSLNFAAGMFIWQSKPNALYFGPTDGGGGPSGIWGFVAASEFGLEAATVSYTCNDGVNAVMWGSASNFNVPNQAYKPGGGVWADGSDARIKTVVGDYTPGLDAVLRLRPVRYTLRDNWERLSLEADARTRRLQRPHRVAAAAKTEFVGLVAQEAEAVMPEMVGRIAAVLDGKPVNDLRTVDMTALPLALVSAVQELAARLAIVESRT
jgi:hypothetical protein